MPEKEIGKLLEKEKEKENLINELNQLSNNFEKNKSRMIEIAKILLKDHYGYLPRNKNKNGNDGMGEMLKTDKENLK